MQPQPNYSGYCNLGMPPFWEHNSNHSNSFNQSYTPPPSSYDFPSQPMGYVSSSGHSSQFGNFHVLFFLNLILIPYFIAVAQTYGMPSTSVQGMRYPTPAPSPSPVHEFPVSTPIIAQLVHQRYQNPHPTSNTRANELDDHTAGVVPLHCNNLTVYQFNLKMMCNIYTNV